MQYSQKIHDGPSENKSVRLQLFLLGSLFTRTDLWEFDSRCWILEKKLYFTLVIIVDGFEFIFCIVCPQMLSLIRSCIFIENMIQSWLAVANFQHLVT